jgi:predicted nucleic acid-binding protein
VLIASVKKIGEKYHNDVLGISHKITERHHEGICSSLLMIELPGALASSTTMPFEKIYEVSVIENFRAAVMPYEAYVKRAVELMLEFRDLKARYEIGSADFHYLATSVQEGCEFFVTTDEKHLLRPSCRDALSRHLKVLAPDEALLKL